MLDASGLIHIAGDHFLVAEDEVDKLLSPRLAPCRIDLRGRRAEGIGVRVRGGELEVLVGTDESKTAGAKTFRMLYCRTASLAELLDREQIPRELDVQVRY